MRFTTASGAAAVLAAASTVSGSEMPKDEARAFGVIEADEQGRIIAFHEKVQAGWERLGYPVNPEVNSGDVRGFSVYPQTIDRDANVREDAARAYWHSVEDRPNLSIIRGTVQRVTWADHSRDEKVVAEGLEYVTPGGETVVIKAEKEVILSAGALRTPLILESSGVGNPR